MVRKKCLNKFQLQIIFQGGELQIVLKLLIRNREVELNETGENPVCVSKFQVTFYTVDY